MGDETQDQGTFADARIPKEDELDFPGPGRHGAREGGVAGGRGILSLGRGVVGGGV